jgi:zinc protease
VTGPELLVETSRALPLVHLTVAERTGALEDPVGKEGLTRLCARLMRRTGGGRAPHEIDALVDSLGGSLGADVAHSSVTFSGTVIARNLDAFSDLLVDVLARPGFAPDELDRLKRETEAEIVEARDNDRSLAHKFFQRAMFDGHAYGRSIGGRLSTISGLDLADVRVLHQRTVVADNLLLACAGDIDPDVAYRLVEKLRQALPSGPALTDTLPDPVGPRGRRLVIVDKPERTQTQILIGALGTHAHDADHFALHVGNTILGGTFTARLMKEIRSKRGWSYGAYSSLPYDRHRQAFSMWTFPKAADAADCLRLELELLADWHDRGVTRRELAWAKRYLVRSHAFAVDTAAKRVGLRLDARLYDLPPRYYEEYLDRIRAVSLDEVNSAIRTRIHPEHLVIVVVGTERVIGEAVRGAIEGLTAHEVVSFDSD